MRIAIVLLIAFLSGAAPAAAQGTIDLRKPEPDSFGNEPAATVTPKAVVPINTMSEKDMLEHREIGALHAKRLMANRPYVNMMDFRARSGLPPENVERIKDMLDF